MLKRIISVVSAFLLLSGVSVSAKLQSSSTEIPENWKFVYSGTASTANTTAEINSSDARTGEKALNMGTSFSGASNTSNNVEAHYTLPESEHGKYTITLFIKGDYSKTSMYVYTGNVPGINDTLFRFSGTAENGWDKYTKEIDYSGEEKLIIRVVKGCNAVVIDDVSFSNGETELISNGGFENMTTITTSVIVTEPAEANPSLSGIVAPENDKMPQNIITFKDDERTILSWINPKSEIAKVRLYETVNNYDMLIDDSLSTESSGNVNYFFESTDKKRTFRLVFTFTDGTVNQYIIGDNTTPKPEIPEWNLTYNIGVDDKGNEIFPMSARIDRTEKHGTKASFKVTSNAVKLKDGSIVLSQPADLEAGKVYMLYIWEKSTGEGTYTVSYGGITLTPIQVKEENGYKLNSYRISFAESTGTDVSLKFEKNIESIWLDDIELYEFVNGNPIGNNLLYNGDFEEGVPGGTMPAVSNLVAENMENSVKLMWDNPSGTMVVYRKDGEEYIKCGQLNADTKEILIGNLVQDETYEFAVTAEAAELNDSEMSIVTAVPFGPEVIIGETIITNQNGICTVIRKIENNRYNGVYNAELIAVLYKNGVITKIASSGGKSLNVGDEENLTVQVDASDADKIKIYTWDKLFGQSILSMCESYNLTE